MDIQRIELWTSRKHYVMRSVRATTVPNAHSVYDKYYHDDNNCILSN